MLFVVGGGAGLWYFSRVADQRPSATLVVLSSSALILALGASCIWSVLRNRVLVFPDRIEVRGFLRTRMLGRDQILGTKIDPNPKDARFVLVPRDSAEKPINIDSMIKLDEAFFDWLGDVPYLDDRESQQALAEIANDSTIGATPDERLEALKKGKRLARAINAVGIFSGLWGLFYPRPYELVIAILVFLPLVALALIACSKGIIRVDQNKNDPHPSLALAIMVPALALAIRSLAGLYVVRWSNALWLAIGIGALIWYATLKVDPTLATRRVGAIAWAAVALFYGYGAGLQANAVLDRSPSTTYEATISRKYISRGRSTSYHLRLNPWGPRQDGSSIQVARPLYDVLGPGDSVYLSLRQGAFGVQWYTVQSYRRHDP